MSSEWSAKLNHIWWLKAHSYLLTGQEVCLLDELEKAKIPLKKGLDWLEEKRLRYDFDYANRKEEENAKNKKAAEKKKAEAVEAQKQHDEFEKVLAELAEVKADRDKLRDENYWLNVELSGMKQTAAIIQKANRR